MLTLAGLLMIKLLLYSASKTVSRKRPGGFPFVEGEFHDQTRHTSHPFCNDHLWLGLVAKLEGHPYL